MKKTVPKHIIIKLLKTRDGEHLKSSQISKDLLQTEDKEKDDCGFHTSNSAKKKKAEQCLESPKRKEFT